MIAKVISVTALVSVCSFLPFPRCLAAPPPISSEVTVSVTVTANSGELRLTGYASPNSVVTFLHEGSVMGTTLADSSSFFDKTFSGLSPGVQSFGIYATDTSNRSTATITFETAILSGVTVTLGNFLLPPTIVVEKAEMKRPEVQSVLGAAKNNSTVFAFIDSGSNRSTSTDGSGSWMIKINEVLHLGMHTARGLVQAQNGDQSTVSQSVPFKVLLSADLNVDGQVNLTDFSILMFNYARGNPPNLAADINDNGPPVDLVDFSIMMFYWTGG